MNANKSHLETIYECVTNCYKSQFKRQADASASSFDQNNVTSTSSQRVDG